ncbi:Phytocyanin domain-containing protein, partial [Psidium guajava]
TFVFCVLQCPTVTGFDYQVGGADGWVVPPANDSKLYNDWASENRFRPGDTLRFKYKKDSVMEVSEAEYKKCNSTRPSFFSNTGNTVYALNQSGPFYFISGVSGHCQRGQRMIVKVLPSEESEASSGSRSSSSSSSSSGSYASYAADFSRLGFLLYVLSDVASCLF